MEPRGTEKQKKDMMRIMAIKSNFISRCAERVNLFGLKNRGKVVHAIEACGKIHAFVTLALDRSSESTSGADRFELGYRTPCTL